MNQTDDQSLTSEGSLTRRLVGVSLIWALALLVLGAVALTALFRQTVMSDLDDRLTRVSEALVAQLEIDALGLSIRQPPTDPSYGQAFSGRYWQIGVFADGRLDAVLTSRSLGDEALPVASYLMSESFTARGEAVVGNSEGPGGEPLRLHLITFEIDAAPGPIVFVAAEDRRPADRRIARFTIAAAGVLTVFALALGAGVFAQVRIGLSPVLRLGRAVADVRDGRAERIAGGYPAELIGLGTELNGLLDHSREVVERSRTHVGNLAHALKTPITVLSNEARTHDGALADMVERQTRTMSDQVEHHLRRARAAANAKAIGARTPVEPVVSDLGRTLNKIYARNGITVSWGMDPDLVFRGERQDLEDLIGNLMDNGCKWAASQVHVHGAAQGDQLLVLSVSDDGPGLSAKARAQVLQRGVRLDEQAPGSGLGLSIVTDLAKVYGGELTLEANEPSGLKAVLVLPKIPAQGAVESLR